jgi:hypothetical protein
MYPSAHSSLSGMHYLFHSDQGEIDQSSSDIIDRNYEYNGKSDSRNLRANDIYLNDIPVNLLCYFFNAENP